MSTDEPDMKKVKKSLIDAGITDENLSQQQMLDCYKVIIESEKSLPTNHQNAANFQNDAKKKIKLNVHKYDPPFYFNDELLKLSVTQRKEKICAFHRSMHRKFHEAQRKSLILVSWGRPINAASKEKFNGTLLKEQSSDDVDDEFQEYVDGNFTEKKQQPVEEKKEDEIYISQAGRQTKRKIYSDDGAGSTKKMKSPQVVNKYKAKRKLTNDEIIKRSSLFQDPPKTYKDKIFDKLEDENKKRQQEEEEMNRFQQTLEPIVDDEFQLSQNENGEKDSSTEDDPTYEEPVKRRRIVPPNPIKKKLATIKKSTSDNKVVQDRDVRPQKKINNVDLNANIEKIEIDSLEASCSNAAKTKLQTRTSIRRNSKMQCPICSKIFDSDKLEKHASNCGEITHSDDDDDEESLILHKISEGTFTCSLCDRAFLKECEYNSHYEKCIPQNSKPVE